MAALNTNSVLGMGVNFEKYACDVTPKAGGMAVWIVVIN